MAIDQLHQADKSNPLLGGSEIRALTQVIEPELLVGHGANCVFAAQHSREIVPRPQSRDVRALASRGYIVLEPMLLCALSVPSAATATIAKYQVPLLRPVIS
jgi:hypothetical protein